LEFCNLQLAAAPLAAALPPPVRAKLMMAILGIVVVGIGLVTMVLLGGRAVKRLARHRSGPSKSLDDAWYKRPLESNAPGSPAEAESDDE
jgi:hypothetical protein